MIKIQSFVFFDIETTGLPWEEKNSTKITELCFVAVSRDNIMITSQGDSPPLNKLTLVFNPCKDITSVAVKMTGLTNELLKHTPPFERKINTILSFLQELPQPVCLVAHNGDRFDYKILLAEFSDADASLPDDLMCIDSLAGFKCILNDIKPYVAPKPVPKPEPILPKTPDPTSDLLTDDEDDWPALNASTEEWQEIENLCNSLSDISYKEITEEPEKNPKTIINKVYKKEKSHKRSERKVFSKENKQTPYARGLTLVDLYKKLLGKEPISWHRAEGDCMMLLQCVVATKNDFIKWADGACKKVIEIQPLVRY